jgi:predicted aspartyl protease
VDSRPGKVSTIDQNSQADLLSKCIGGKQFTIPSTIAYNGMSLTTSDALVDTGANGYIFVNRQFAERIKRHLPVTVYGDLPSVPVGGYTGKTDQKIREALKAHIRIQGRLLLDQIMVVLEMKHDIILGKTFFESHDIPVDVRRRRLMFPDSMPPSLPSSDIRMDDAGDLLKNPAYDEDVHRREILMSKEDKRRRDGRAVKQRLAEVEEQIKAAPRPTPCILTRKVAEALDMEVLDVATFTKLTNDEGMESFVITLEEIDRFIQDKRDARSSGLEDDTPEDRESILRAVPPAYADYLDVFSKARSDELAPFRVGVDHRIELLPGARPEDLHYSPLYKMSLEELEACRKYIIDNLSKDFITSSSAPWAAPVLMATKASGGLRFCVDYRKLNAITRKDQYPLPLIEETLSRITKAKIFTKIDIRQAFHKVRMRPEDEDLTTFRTRYGAYKYKVVPFGLTNGPATFQRFINNLLLGYLDDFCHAYIDDILIYSEDLQAGRGGRRRCDPGPRRHHGHRHTRFQRLDPAHRRAPLRQLLRP